MNTTAPMSRMPLRWMLLAGLVGGLAEVLWVWLYSAYAGTDSAVVAREVTESLFGRGAGGAYAPVLGIALHMALSLTVAAGFMLVLWRWAARRGPLGIMGAAFAALAAIWAINFLLVLPAINSDFVGLLPPAVTFTSKMLFGGAMGYALVCGTGRVD